MCECFSCLVQFICVNVSVAWFSFDPATSHDDLIFSNNNQSVTCPGFDHRVAMGSVGFSKGVHYWELVIDSYDCHTDPSIGVCRYDVDKGVILGENVCSHWHMRTYIQTHTYIYMCVCMCAIAFVDRYHSESYDITFCAE